MMAGVWAYMLVLAVLQPIPCQGATVFVPGEHGTTRVTLPSGLTVANNEPIADWDTSNVKSMKYVYEHYFGPSSHI